MEIKEVRAIEQIKATSTDFEAIVNGEKVEGCLDWNEETGYTFFLDGVSDNFYEWLEVEENYEALTNAIEEVALNGTGAK